MLINLIYLETIKDWHVQVQENEIEDALIDRFQVLRLRKLVKALLTIESSLDADVRVECLD